MNRLLEQNKSNMNGYFVGMAIIPLFAVFAWTFEPNGTEREIEKMAIGAALVLPPVICPTMAILYLRTKFRLAKLCGESTPTYAKKELKAVFTSEAERILKAKLNSNNAPTFLGLDLPKTRSFEEHDSDMQGRLKGFQRDSEEHLIVGVGENVQELHKSIPDQWREKLSMQQQEGAA